MGKLKESLRDEVVFNLHFTDIQYVDDSLTTQEAREVLELIATNCFIDDVEIQKWIDYYRAI
jgi:hypothetical protein